MENLRERLARRLRERMSKSVTMDTQTKVAVRSGVSQSTVQRILARDQAATVDVLEQLSQAFGVVNAEHFLLDDEECDLLRLWARLGTEDRRRVDGFIRVTAQAPTGQNPQILNYSTTRDVPPELKAASARQAERPIATRRAQNPAAPHHVAPKDTERKRRKA